MSTNQLDGLTPLQIQQAAGINVAKPTCGIYGTFDGAGSVLPAGVKGFLYIPYACNLAAITLLADTVGSVVLDIWKTPLGSFPPSSGNSITASDLPTITNAQTYQDTNLTGWTKTVNAGDTLWFNVNSCTAITKLALTLTVTQS